MTLPRLKRAYPTTDDARRVEQNVAEAINPVLDQRILGGVLLTDIALASGQANTVNHGLGRPYSGWMLTNNNTDCRVWSGTSTLPDRQLVLYASVATTVSLWVF